MLTNATTAWTNTTYNLAKCMISIQRSRLLTFLPTSFLLASPFSALTLPKVAPEDHDTVH